MTKGKNIPTQFLGSASGLSVIALAGALALTSCGDKKPEEMKTEDKTVEAPKPSAKEREETKKDAPAQPKATDAAQKKLAEHKESVAKLRDRVDSRDYSAPKEIESSINELSKLVDESEQILANMERSSSKTQADLDAALKKLDDAIDTASKKLDEWSQREQAALKARENTKLPVDQDSGLIIGLDGGLYEHYKASQIEKAQQHLRELELYFGPVDGYFGKPTMDAIGAFQKQNSLQVSGVPSPMTRKYLYAK